METDAGAAPVVPGADGSLLASLRTRGCPTCEHLVRVTFEFLCRFESDLSTRDDARQRFAEELGFCPLHTWQLAACMAPQDASAALPRFAERTASEMSSLAESPGPMVDHWLARFLGREQCRVCALLRKAEADFTARLAEFVSRPAGQEEYAHSHGVCLRHLEGLLRAVSTDALRRSLLRQAAERFTELAKEMTAYASKHRSLRRYLATDDEKDAYRRALIHLAGDKQVCLPWTWGEVQW